MFSWESYKFSETAIERRRVAASVFTRSRSSDDLSAGYEQ